MCDSMPWSRTNALSLGIDRTLGRITSGKRSQATEVTLPRIPDNAHRYKEPLATTEQPAMAQSVHQEN
jgi:hypothetical protein